MVHSKQQAPLPSHSVTGLTNWTISGPGFANRFDPHLDIPKLPPEGTQGLVDSDDALVDAAYVSWGPVTNVQRPVRLYINTGDYVIMTWNNEQNRLQISVAGITAGHRVKVYPWIGGSQLAANVVIVRIEPVTAVMNLKHLAVMFNPELRHTLVRVLCKTTGVTWPAHFEAGTEIAWHDRHNSHRDSTALPRMTTDTSPVHALNSTNS